MNTPPNEKEPPQEAPIDAAETLAFELFGGIQYGDSRDNPEWQRKTLAAAANIIRDAFTAEREKVRGELVKKIDGLDYPPDAGWEERRDWDYFIERTLHALLSPSHTERT